jgi:hypothetical protein
MAASFEPPSERRLLVALRRMRLFVIFLMAGRR